MPASDGTTALSCRDLSVGYGTHVVIRNLSIGFLPGRWTSIVGPNGCGKSTLLRALAGLEPALSGTVSLEGRALSSWRRRERARRVAWLAQSSAVTDLTGAEVVALGRFAHSGWLAHREADDEAAMYRAMMATGSLAWAHRRLSTLSGGERQRVHLARTLAVEASVMLLDEPTTHLDPPHQEDIVRLLREQVRGCGASVVSAIHDLSLALAADRIVVLGYRGLVGHGTIAEALAGDWLSAAFETPVNVVEHAGAYLWRPSLETTPVPIERPIP
jgi:iron complex transport system ATP-binding protein